MQTKKKRGTADDLEAFNKPKKQNTGKHRRLQT